MKEVFTTNDRDYIIKFYEQAQKDEKGQIRWVDENSSITEKENKIHSLWFYKELNNGDFICVEFGPKEISEIAEKLKEIESRKCEPSYEDF